MTIPAFKPPAFLDNQNAETIHKRMMDMLPADIDKTEGGFPWDFTRPTASEKAELLEFFLVETLKIMFPAWAYAEWLDRHAQARGLTRRPPNPASGMLLVAGTPGTSIPAGFRFAVPGIGDTPAIQYQTSERQVIGTGGTVLFQAVAVEGGAFGNVAAGTITIMLSPINGITGVTNPEPFTGGTDTETDDALRQRIDELDLASAASYVGSDIDYIRWAREVPGVGTALVQPEWAGPGTVKVIVLDTTGQPANAAIVTAVHNNIVSPANRMNRKAPIGAAVTIEAPLPRVINYAFTCELQPGETQGTVVDRFTISLRTYYIEAKKEGIVRYNRIASLLSMTPGIRDFSSLLVNGATLNVVIAADEYPVTGTISATVGGAA